MELQKRYGVSIGADDWFKDDVQYVYEKGLMLGTGEGTFSPYLKDVYKRQRMNRLFLHTEILCDLLLRQFSHGFQRIQHYHFRVSDAKYRRCV